MNFNIDIFLLYCIKKYCFAKNGVAAYFIILNRKSIIMTSTDKKKTGNAMFYVILVAIIGISIYYFAYGGGKKLSQQEILNGKWSKVSVNNGFEFISPFDIKEDSKFNEDYLFDNSGMVKKISSLMGGNEEINLLVKSVTYNDEFEPDVNYGVEKVIYDLKNDNSIELKSTDVKDIVVGGISGKRVSARYKALTGDFIYENIMVEEDPVLHQLVFVGKQDGDNTLQIAEKLLESLSLE